MAFLAPALPFLIKGGAALGSSLIGSKLSKVKPSAQEQAVLNQNAEAQKLGLSQAKTLFPQGQSLIGMGAQAANPALNYWQSLLSGNRALATSAMAPEISRIGQGYQQAGRTSAALMPRGGPSASFLSEQPFNQQRDVTSLLQGARPQAAGNLFQAGQGIMSSGAGLLQSGIGALYGSTAAGRDILSQAQNARELEAQRGRSIGGGLFDFIKDFGIDSLFKQGQLTGNRPSGVSSEDYGPWKVR